VSQDVRILRDEVRVVRYSWIRREILSGSSANAVAHRIGVSTPALLSHLFVMGLRYHDAKGWVDSQA
jgi:hypothetical protein